MINQIFVIFIEYVYWTVFNSHPPQQKLGVLQTDGSPSNGTTTKNPSAIKQHLQKNSLPEFVQLPNDLKQRILTLHTSQEVQ